MLIKTLLNKVERFKSFVYGSVCIMLVNGTEALVIDIEPRRNRRPICPECGKPGTLYDRQPVRLFEHLPIWTFKAFFHYAPRRVKCPEHGIKVEASPWGLRQGTDDHFVPGFSGSLGEATLLARDGQGVRDQLGYGLPGRQIRRRLRSCPQKS